jgi:DNA-binding NarL/FixJ family response regulator
VDSEAKHPVVILYKHSLLGEGLAKYLRSQCGVEVMVASGHDLQAVTSALALGPAVVIFELSDALRQVELSALAPQAVLIDVSTVMARGQVLSPDATVLERILAAVSGSSGHQPSPKDQG